MNTFPQSDDDRAMFTELLQRQYIDWTPPQNNPRKWYVDDATAFDTAAPMENFKTPEEFVVGMGRYLFDRAVKADMNVKDVLRVSRLSDDVVLTEITFEAVVQLEPNREPITAQGQQTQIWVRRNGQWLVFHEHNSTPSFQALE